jgi:hypothetical protein
MPLRAADQSQWCSQHPALRWARLESGDLNGNCGRWPWAEDGSTAGADEQGLAARPRLHLSTRSAPDPHNLGDAMSSFGASAPGTSPLKTEAAHSPCPLAHPMGEGWVRVRGTVNLPLEWIVPGLTALRFWSRPGPFEFGAGKPLGVLPPRPDSNALD